MFSILGRDAVSVRFGQHVFDLPAAGAPPAPGSGGRGPGAGADAEDCSRVNQRYDPLDNILGQGRSVELSARACQARCLVVHGCAYYSFWPVQHYHDLGMGFKSSLQNSNETVCMLNRPARAHTATTHCGSHCHPLRVVLTNTPVSVSAGRTGAATSRAR